MASSTVIAPYVFCSQASNKKFPKTIVILKAIFEITKVYTDFFKKKRPIFCSETHNRWWEPSGAEAS